jgi:hypothetical protein
MKNEIIMALLECLSSHNYFFSMDLYFSYLHMSFLVNTKFMEFDRIKLP